MASRRENTVISADGHESSKEADGPQYHDNYPCDYNWAKLWNAKNLEIEEGNRGLDESNGQDAGYDE